MLEQDAHCNVFAYTRDVWTSEWLRVRFENNSLLFGLLLLVVAE